MQVAVYDLRETYLLLYAKESYDVLRRESGFLLSLAHIL